MSGWRSWVRRDDSVPGSSGRICTHEAGQAGFSSSPFTALCALRPHTTSAGDSMGGPIRLRVTGAGILRVDATFTFPHCDWSVLNTSCRPSTSPSHFCQRSFRAGAHVGLLYFVMPASRPAWRSGNWPTDERERENSIFNSAAGKISVGLLCHSRHSLNTSNH